MHERILVATDLDLDTSPALGAAVAPFVSASAALALCYVRWEPERYLDIGERVDERRVLDERARTRLDLWASTFLPGCPRDLLVEASGDPTGGIAHVAERWAADLLVVAASGASGLWHKLLGSVPDQAVRHATADVLVARSSPASHLVLAGTDLSDPSFGAVAAAAAEARHRQGALVVMHVVEGGSAAPFDAMGRDAKDYERRVGARSWVDHAMAKTGAHGEVEIHEGAPARLIVERGAVLGAELIVVASNGRTGLSRVLLGSVAEEVTRSAPCSVLVVRR